MKPRAEFAKFPPANVRYRDQQSEVRGESAMRVTAKKLELAEAQAERLATATEAHPVRNPANQETLPAPISQAM